MSDDRQHLICERGTGEILIAMTDASIGSLGKLPRCKGTTRRPRLLVLWSIWYVISFCVIASRAEANSPGFLLGINASIRDGKLAFPAMEAIGVQSIRLDVSWSLVEKSPRHYEIPKWVANTVNTAVAHHIKPMLILAYGNRLYGGDKPTTTAAITAFGTYAKYVVTHFKDRVRYYELWNEWETHTGKTTPGSPRSYIRLAKRVYPQIKAADPSAVVLSGGISDIRNSSAGYSWIRRFLVLGGLQYVDALSLHPYPEPGGHLSPEYAIRKVETIYNMAKRRAGKKPVNIYITEMGYATYSGTLGVSREAAADYLARFMLLAAALPYVRGVWWYSLEDLGQTRSYGGDHMGLFTHSYRQKPAARMYAAVSTLFREYRVERASESRGKYEEFLSGHNNHRIVTWSNGGVTVRGTARGLLEEPLIDLGIIRKFRN